MARPSRPLADRLAEQLQTLPNGCMIYTGTIMNAGYGTIGRGGRGTGSMLAHRAAYEVWVGPIPSGMQVHHVCYERRCCNPEHLRLVTQRDNLLDDDSSSPSNVNHRKQTCDHGHAFDEANTYHYKDRRYCRKCRARRERERKQRLRIQST